ncbi:MAG: L-asparaginase [Candidatus Cloacimonadota bacterium]|nr:MAG: L-asparaginase [Candidatus Cloacimonadota bacterium]
METIIVHCGAGTLRDMGGRKAAVIDSVEAGYAVLERGGSALDAAIQATIILEDSPYSNAGRGSGLNLEGEVEMDASIMTDDLRCGAVACIKNIRNPIIVARYVMEETDHVILAGKGAQRFAKILGIKRYNPITARSKELYNKFLKKVKQGKGTQYFPHLPDYIKHYNADTVGAIAMDCKGRIAVTNSTAGIMLKLPGRVGDTPVFGAGLFADRAGGVSATGHGEGIIRLCLSKVAVDSMKTNTAQQSVSYAIRKAKKHKIRCGLIAIDRRGRIGSAHTVDAMPTAYITKGTLTYKE